MQNNSGSGPSRVDEDTGGEERPGLPRAPSSCLQIAFEDHDLQVPALPQVEEQAPALRLSRLPNTFERGETEKAHEGHPQEHKPPSWRKYFGFYYALYGSGLFVFTVYLLANIAYVVWHSKKIIDGKFFEVLGWGLVVSRGCGALLRMNCALVLVPVSHDFITWVRSDPFLDRLLPLDAAVRIHKRIAYWIWILGVTHSFAHVFNMNKLSTLPKETFDEYFPGLEQHTNVYEWLYKTLPGLTGAILWVCMMLIFSSAMSNTRDKSFEVFWFTHHLYIVFIVALIAHGCLSIFAAPAYWQWIIGPLVLFAHGKLGQAYHGTKKCKIERISGENSGVIALYFKRPRGFDYKGGQYVRLNCPKIARHQWHPFTLTSSPEEKFLSVHIKIVGDWTGQLASLLNPSNQLGNVPVPQDVDASFLHVQGPFGAPSEHVFDSKVAVMIGAGIGVTPYASILKTMFYRLLLASVAPAQYQLKLLDVERVHFYWICRDRSSFEWFAYLRRDLEVRSRGFLEVRTYITRQEKPGDGEDPDPLLGLEAHTYYGRPDFNAIFEALTKVYPKEKIGVFFCGPKPVSNAVRKAVTQASSPSGTRFVFRKENF